MPDVKKLVMLTEYGATPEKIAKVLGPTRNQIMRAIRDFEKAVREHEMRGCGYPEEYRTIGAWYRRAKKRLQDLATYGCAETPSIADPESPDTGPSDKSSG